MKRFVLLILFSCLGVAIISASPKIIPRHYVVGYITEVTSVQDGLLIMIENDNGHVVPNTAKNTPYGWLLVSEDDPVMVEMALYCWKNNLEVAVYCDGTNPTGYGVLTQVDPLIRKARP